MSIRKIDQITTQSISQPSLENSGFSAHPVSTGCSSIKAAPKSSTHLLSQRPQLTPPNSHYLFDIFCLQERMEGVSQKQLEYFEFDSKQKTKEIESLELENKRAFEAYAKKQASHQSWGILTNVSQYITGTSTLLIASSMTGWPGIVLGVSGGVTLTNRVINDTIGWGAITSLITKTEKLQEELTEKIETGAYCLALGLGLASGFGAYQAGTLVLSQSYKSLESALSLSGKVVETTSHLGTAYSDKQMKGLQATHLEIGANITATEQGLRKECSQLATTIETTGQMANTIGQIVAAQELPQNI